MENNSKNSTGTLTQQDKKHTPYGSIPYNWSVAPLIDITSNKGIVRGPFGGALKKEIFVKEGYKVYQQQNAIYKNVDQGNYYINEEKYNELKRFAIAQGDFIISCSGTIGKIYEIPESFKPGVINQALLKITLDESVVNRDFFKYHFEWSRFQAMIIDNTQGGAMKNLVGMDIFKNTLFIQPPLLEQQKIAQILSTWDKAIEKTEQLIQAKTQLKKGLMQQLLTGRKRFKEFEGEEWKEYTFGKLGFTFNGLTGKTKVDFGAGMPYIPYLNIINNSRVNPDQMDFVDVKLGEKQNMVKYGDIFFTTSSETPDEAGMPSVLLDDLDNTYLNSFCFGFRLHDFETLVPTFARFYLRSYLVRKDIFRLAQGSTRYNISKNEIMKIRLLLPPTLEQQKIASLLSNLEDELSILKSTMIKFKVQKKGLMQKLLTGEVRVNNN